MTLLNNVHTVGDWSEEFVLDLKYAFIYIVHVYNIHVYIHVLNTVYMRSYTCVYIHVLNTVYMQVRSRKFRKIMVLHLLIYM